MSAALAVAPRRRSPQPTAPLTPEQELELLIVEQAADDTPYASIPKSQVSLDAPVHNGDSGASTVGEEFIGYDPWGSVDAAIDSGLEPADAAYCGPIISHLKPRRGEALVDPRKTPHGTAGGYQNHKCRCPLCRVAWATYKRERRAARRAQ